MKRIFQGRDRKKADLILTILASQAIKTEITRTASGAYEILVKADDREKALFHLDRYAQENRPLIKQIIETGPSSFYSPAVLVIMGLIALVHIICIKTNIHDQAVFRFGASSYFIRQGETFRAITALFLHSDIRHLIGNMAGLLVLGAPIVRLTGYGTGPFLLLCAGTAGNLISNGLGMDARLSIGASTAVMGAAGLLAARQVVLGHGISRFKGLAPVAAGATLMAMFSHGENTDVSAHFFGFAAGTGIGIIGLPLIHIWSETGSRPGPRPGPRRGELLDRLFLGLTLVILGTALVSGLLFLF